MRIEGLTEEVNALTILVYHPHESGCCSFCAWAIWNLISSDHIPEGIPLGKEVTIPVTATQGLNDYGRVGYNGPCPSPGASHRVNYKIYGLDEFLTVRGGSTQHALIPAMRGHVVQFGETFAMYGR